MTTRKQDELPEVNRFMAAQDRLDEFKERNQAVFDELYRIVEEYNTALQEADKAVRATGQSHGPFLREKIVTKYDADKLYDALGHDAFIRAGGIIETVSQYTIDKKKFDSHVASGNIPQELADEIKVSTPHYKKINKLVI